MSNKELEGPSLPPKVDGKRVGWIKLSVPQVVEAAFSSVDAKVGSTLPKQSLVRVKWWGEERGASLFRPETIRNASKNAKASTLAGFDMHSLRICYPICASPKLLAEYLRDMKQVVFDVIDASSKTKYGRCVLPFSQILTTQNGEYLFRSVNNALYDIYPSNVSATSQDAIGYLAINLTVEWGNMTEDKPTIREPDLERKAIAMMGSPEPTPYHSAPLPSNAYSDRSERQFPVVHFSEPQASSLPIMSPEYQMSPDLTIQDSRREQSDMNTETFQRPTSTRNSNLDRILEKGKSLQMSMESAMAKSTKEVYYNPLQLHNEGQDCSTTEVDAAKLDAELALYKSMTSALEDKKQTIAAGASEVASSSIPEANEYSAQEGAHSVYNALDVHAESLELSKSILEYIRERRDASLSTRFLPTRISITHDSLDSVLQHNDEASERAPDVVTVASVQSSLRKRLVPLQMSNAAPVLDGDMKSLVQTSLRRKLHFYCHCKCEEKASRTPRKRKRPELLQGYMTLCGSVRIEEIRQNASSYAENLHRIDLYALEDLTPNKSGNASAIRRRKHKLFPKRVGVLKVSFQFCTLPLSNFNEEEDETAIRIDEDQSSLASGSNAPPSIHIPGNSHDGRSSALSSSPVWSESISRSLSQTTDVSSGRHYRSHDSQLQFEVLIEKAIGLQIPEDSGVDIAKKQSLQLRVAFIPPAFTRSSPHTKSANRSVRRKLSISRCRKGMLFGATIGYFSLFSVWGSSTSAKIAGKSQQVIELWIEQDGKEPLLLGLVKISLKSFQSSLQDPDTVALQPLPYVGADNSYAVINPFTGHQLGHLRVVLAVGTPEQLIAFQPVWKSIVKLQSIVRGVLCRIQLSKQGMMKSDKEDKVEGNQTQEHTLDRGEGSGESVYYVDAFSDTCHELTFEIREQFPDTYYSDNLIGCRVEGHVRTCNSNGKDEAADTPFEIWWDANDQMLNSQHVHVFGATEKASPHSLSTSSCIHFQVIPVVNQPCDVDCEVGSGILMLRDVVLSSHHVSEYRSGTEDEQCIDLGIDTQLTWTKNDRHFIRTLPLRIGIRPLRKEESTESEAPATSSKKPMPNADPSRIKASSLTEAGIIISVEVQSVAGLERMLRAALDATSSYEESGCGSHKWLLEGGLKDRQVKLVAECTVNIGTELLSGDLHARNSHFGVVYQEEDRWLMRATFGPVVVALDDKDADVSLLRKAKHFRMKVHGDMIHSLQHRPMTIVLLAADSATDLKCQIAHLEVPLAPVLYSKTGVEGSFPAEVNKASVGLAKVHAYINHDVNLEHEEGVNKSDEDVALPTVDQDENETVANDDVDSYLEIQVIRAYNLILEDIETEMPSTFAVISVQDDGISLSPMAGAQTSRVTAVFQGTSPCWEHHCRYPTPKTSFDTYRLIVHIGHDSTHALSSPLAEKYRSSRANASGVQSSTFIGKASIDLALLKNRWQEIHGWYHVYDDNEIARGQVEVLVRVVETQKDESVMSTAEVDQTPSVHDNLPFQRGDASHINERDFTSIQHVASDIQASLGHLSSSLNAYGQWTSANVTDNISLANETPTATQDESNEDAPAQEHNSVGRETASTTSELDQAAVSIGPSASDSVRTVADSAYHDASLAQTTLVSPLRLYDDDQTEEEEETEMCFDTTRRGPVTPNSLHIHEMASPSFDSDSSDEDQSPPRLVPPTQEHATTMHNFVDVSRGLDGVDLQNTLKQSDLQDDSNRGRQAPIPPLAKMVSSESNVGAGLSYGDLSSTRASFASSRQSELESNASNGPNMSGESARADEDKTEVNKNVDDCSAASISTPHVTSVNSPEARSPEVQTEVQQETPELTLSVLTRTIPLTRISESDEKSDDCSLRASGEIARDDFECKEIAQTQCTGAVANAQAIPTSGFAYHLMITTGAGEDTGTDQIEAETPQFVDKSTQVDPADFPPEDFSSEGGSVDSYAENLPPRGEVPMDVSTSQFTQTLELIDLADHYDASIGRWIHDPQHFHGDSTRSLYNASQHDLNRGVGNAAERGHHQDGNIEAQGATVERYTVTSDKFDLICDLLRDIREACSDLRSQKAMQAAEDAVKETQATPSVDDEEKQADEESLEGKEEESMDLIVEQSETEAAQVITKTSNSHVRLPDTPEAELLSTQPEEIPATQYGESINQNQAAGKLRDCEETKRIEDTNAVASSEHSSGESISVRNAGGSGIASNSDSELSLSLESFFDDLPPAQRSSKQDSETERIARIMQGSVKYWIDDDSSASEDEADENASTNTDKGTYV